MPLSFVLIYFQSAQGMRKRQCSNRLSFSESSLRHLQLYKNKMKCLWFKKLLLYRYSLLFMLFSQYHLRIPIIFLFPYVHIQFLGSLCLFLSCLLLVVDLHLALLALLIMQIPSAFHLSAAAHSLLTPLLLLRFIVTSLSLI